MLLTPISGAEQTSCVGGEILVRIKFVLLEKIFRAKREQTFDMNVIKCIANTVYMQMLSWCSSKASEDVPMFLKECSIKMENQILFYAFFVDAL